jgi:hypothetical protein
LTDALTPDELAAIRKRCEAAIDGLDHYRRADIVLEVADEIDDITESVTDVPRLLDEIERLQQFKLAYELYQSKTEWVQEQQNYKWGFNSLGMHRADVLRRHIEHQRKEIAILRNELAAIGKDAE